MRRPKQFLVSYYFAGMKYDCCETFTRKRDAVRSAFALVSVGFPAVVRRIK